MHVHQERVVRLELFARKAAVDGRLRVGHGARALGWRDASEAAVEHEPAAYIVQDGARARLLREPVVGLAALRAPDARAGGEQLGADEFELIIVGVSARVVGPRLPWAQSGRSFGEECLQLGGLLGEPRVAHVHVEELREALEDSIGEALRNFAGVPRAHIHAGADDQGEPWFRSCRAVVVQDRAAVLGQERMWDDGDKGAGPLFLRALLELEEHVPAVVLEASLVRPVDVRHVAQDGSVAVRVPRPGLALRLRHRVAQRVEQLASRHRARLRAHHVVHADDEGSVWRPMRLVALAHSLLGVRHALVAHDALLVRVVRLVGAARADDVHRDGDKRAGAVGLDLVVGAAQLFVLVVQALLDQLREGLAHALGTLVEPLEVGPDADLHWRLHAPADAVHHQGHELLVLVLAQKLAQHVEHPVRAPGPREVEHAV